MASLVNKLKRPFVKFSMRRKEYRIYLQGSMSHQEQLRAKEHISELVDCLRRGAPPHRATKRWLESLDDEMYERISRTHLVEPRESIEAQQLAGLCEYVRKRKERSIRASSQQIYKNVTDNLLTFFSPTAPIHKILPPDVDRFRAWLDTQAHRTKRNQGLAPATVGKRLKVCREWFDVAIDNGWLEKNPFRHLKNLEPIISAEDRTYVEAKVVDRLIEDAEDNEWRLLLALWRYAGLRQLEPFSLTWEGVDWEQGRMEVFSHKQNVQAKVRRTIPIWPEVRPWLEQQRDECPQQTPWVIFRRRYRFDTHPDRRHAGGANLHTKLKQQCIRCGILPWKDLTKSLRSSGETDRTRAGHWQLWEIAYWWNHSEQVQRRHYLTVTDASFAAAQPPAEAGVPTSEKPVYRLGVPKDSQDPSFQRSSGTPNSREDDDSLGNSGEPKGIRGSQSGGDRNLLGNFIKSDLI